MGGTDFVVAPVPGEMLPASEIGGKAHNLARLAGIPGVRVPPWLVIGVRAFDAFVLEGSALTLGAAHLRGRNSTQTEDRAARL